MKIIKGVLTYTLLLLGGAAILAVALIGCMFLFPSFSVFGWKIMFSSNETVQNVSTVKSLNKGEEYTIKIDAKLHDVNIYQFSDNTRKVEIQKIDDMFGLYDTSTMETYSKELDVKFTGNTLEMVAGQIDGAILPRESRINIFLPNSSTYKFVIQTTKGDININGVATKENVSDLKVKGLDLKTVDGDFSWSNVATTNVISLYNETSGSASIDNSASNYTKNDFMRFVQLDNLSATTEYGKFDFSLNYDDADTYIVTTQAYNGKTFMGRLTESGWHKNQEFDAHSGNSIISTMRESAKSDTSNANEFYLNCVRGEFTFQNLIAKGLTVIGDDVLIKGDNIVTLKDFNFNAPNGFFQIGTLNSSLSTIATNNINVNLTQAQGELSIKTTYGDISIDRVSQNATLKSEHGNITIKNATASLSAIAEHGDIYVEKFSGKVYLKNTHGRITAIYNDSSFVIRESNKDADYQKYAALNCEMINDEGSINAVNIILPTTLRTTGGGTINAIFKEMALKGYNHVVELASGQANITVPNTQAFMYKGDGKILGSVGSVAMKKSSEMGTANALGFVKVLDSSVADADLAALEVKATTANVVFAKYDTTKDYAAQYKA